MRLSLLAVSVIYFSMAGSLALADSTNSVCEAVKEKAWKTKQVVDERQQALRLAQKQSRFAYSQLVECRPGAIFSGRRAQRCAHAQSEVPLSVNVQLEAEDQLQAALTDYQEKLDWVSEECTSDEPMVDRHELLARITSLENVVKALKDLVGQLNAQ